MTGPQFNGIINVYKEKGFTSHDVVNKLRYILNMKRIGHTGTLDPDVTGVLPICIGKATRVAEYLQDDDKTYSGIMKLGIQTDTQDISGTITNKSERIPNYYEIENIVKNYLGEIEQIPPMFSAVHHKGKRLHELAREGIVVEREPRKIRIYNLQILEYNYPFVSFSCACSKGTYIRTLINDMGYDLGSYASLYKLERTQVGSFNINESIKLDDIRAMVEAKNYSFLRPIDQAIDRFKSLVVDDKYFDKLINGSKINTNLDQNESLHRVYCRNKFIGIGCIKSFEDTNKIILTKMLYTE